MWSQGHPLVCAGETGSLLSISSEHTRPLRIFTGVCVFKLNNLPPDSSPSSGEFLSPVCLLWSLFHMTGFPQMPGEPRPTFPAGEQRSGALYPHRGQFRSGAAWPGAGLGTGPGGPGGGAWRWELPMLHAAPQWPGVRGSSPSKTYANRRRGVGPLRSFCGTFVHTVPAASPVGAARLLIPPRAGGSSQRRSHHTPPAVHLGDSPNHGTDGWTEGRVKEPAPEGKGLDSGPPEASLAPRVFAARSFLLLPSPHPGILPARPRSPSLVPRIPPAGPPI